MEELEQQWRADAEAKRPEFVARARGEIGDDADHVSIENIVTGDVENYIVEQRKLYQHTAWRTEQIETARNKTAAAKAVKEAERLDQRKRIREEQLPLLTREDAEASHTIKAARTAKATLDVACEAVYSKYQTAANDLKELGEAPDAIPSAKEVIPNVFAEREAQALAAQAQALAPPPPVLSLLPPDGAGSGATEGDLVCLEKIVSTAIGVDRLARKELRDQFVSWVNSLSGKFDRLSDLIKAVKKYEAKLAPFEQEKEQERGKTPAKHPLLLPKLKDASAARKLLEAIKGRLPNGVDEKDGTAADSTAPPDPLNEGKGAANDAQVHGADDADEATQRTDDDEATQRADDATDSAATHSDSSTQTEPMPEMPPPPRPITEEEVKGSKWNKKLAQELEIKTKELADKNAHLSDMHRRMCELQDKHDPTQQSRLIDSLNADKDALKDELDAAKKKIKDLEAPHKKSCDDEHDAYTGLDELATDSNRTLADVEGDLLEVHKQYYKHISTLRHKCSVCKHASKKGQNTMCYNAACKAKGEQKREHEDNSLWFDHNVLARKAGMTASIPKSCVLDAAQQAS